MWGERIIPQSGIVCFGNGVEPWSLCVIVVHSSLGQRLIRHEWEASLPDMGLSKSVRTKVQRHFQSGQYLIREKFVPPTKRHLLGFKGKPPPSPFVGSCVTRRSALSQHAKPWSHSCSLHMCSSGTLIIRPKAYKARVGDVFLRCGIEQILEDRLNAISKEDNTWLGAEMKVLPQIYNNCYLSCHIYDYRYNNIWTYGFHP